jgi:ligand-binding sensor domain-containing protein
MRTMLRGALLVLAIAAATAAAAENWKHITKQDGLPGDEVQFIKQDDAGTVWVGTLSGLASLEDGRPVVRIKEGEFWDVLRVGKDRYWVGTAGGAVLLEGDKQTLTLQGNTVAPIMSYDEKTLWAISKNRGTEENVLVENSGEGWKPVARFQKERVVDLYKSSDGLVWVAVDGNGIYAVDPKKGPEQAVHHLEGLNVTAFFEDGRKQIWVGLWGRGVRVREANGWTAHLTKEDSYIFSIRQDKTGKIWVATNAHGLWRYDGEKWVNDLRDEGGINMLAATSDGRVWVSSQTTGGLRYWDGKAWQVSLGTTLPIRCLLETKDGKLLAGGVLDGLYIKQ